MTARARIRAAVPGDGALLNAGLRALSDAMGDAHRADDALIERACFGPDPALYGQLAEAEGALLGVAVYSPMLSTYRGRIGVYVSDLWVAKAARGQGLGRRLLASVKADAVRRWGPGFLRLAVYHHNPDAIRLYERLGFRGKADELWLTLEGDAWEALA